MEGALLLTGLLTAGFLGGLHGLGEDVSGGGFGASDDVGVDAEGDSRVCMTQASRDDVDGDAGEQQRGGVQVPEVV